MWHKPANPGYGEIYQRVAGFGPQSLNGKLTDDQGEEQGRERTWWSHYKEGSSSNYEGKKQGYPPGALFL